MVCYRSLLFGLHDGCLDLTNTRAGDKNLNRVGTTKTQHSYLAVFPHQGQVRSHCHVTLSGRNNGGDWLVLFDTCSSHCDGG